MKTNDIMRNLIVHGKQIFGYVDRGVSTQNLTGKKMKEAVDATDITYSAGNVQLVYTPNPKSQYRSHWESDTAASNAANKYFSCSTGFSMLSITVDGASWGL
ncbi:unnamed protein product [Rotaria magnacalcarata]|uniref:Uncharacterized protein n=1 Tax=Rotaria magnacalcarata TaxID=392030 RepID=A0A814DW62_9BILA|nr:unnamed protein product [Rotaria magnacalcarata]